MKRRQRVQKPRDRASKGCSEQKAFVVVVTGAKVEGKSGQSAPASLIPLPGSESGAHVRQVIRERERTDGLWGKSREGQAGYKKSGLMPRSEGIGGRIREDEAERRRGATQPVPASEGRRSERGRVVSSRRAAIVPQGTMDLTPSGGHKDKREL